MYEKVGDLFRNKFGYYAGWAHSVLFAAELPQFRCLLPQKIQDEMLEYSKLQMEINAKKKLLKKNNKINHEII